MSRTSSKLSAPQHGEHSSTLPEMTSPNWGRKWRICRAVGCWCSVVAIAANTLRLGCAQAVEQVSFPYVAYVAAPNTLVLSGPGDPYYPTQQLPVGHAVEVYRHDGTEWCAVRPPSGSYCLIEAQDIRPTSSQTAEVSSENTLVRIGSQLSFDANNVQIRLHRGEQVQLLPGASGPGSRWVTIAPPAGEFRWIAASQLSRTPPVEGDRSVRATTAWKGQGKHHRAHAISPVVPHGFGHLVQNVEGLPAPSPTAPAPELARSNFPAPPKNLFAEPQAATVVPGSPAATEVVTHSSPAPPALLGSTSPQPPGALPLPADEGTQIAVPQSTPRVRFGYSRAVTGPASGRVKELQLRLSQMVIKPKEEWGFEQLTAEATAMLNASDSVSEREYLRDLLDRISRFERVQQGQVAVTSSASNTPGDPGRDDFTGQTSRVRELARDDLANAEDPFDSKQTRTDEPRYDAVGRLKPVMSEHEDAPRFALVDDRGGVVSFVTPTPDLNLKPYVGMRIGVNGSRGFMPEYRKAHVTAGRVTPIEDRIRR